MDSTERKTDYTAYAIEWMEAHEQPLPPDKQIALESVPSYLNKKLGERNLSTAQLFEAAGTERSTGYKIMNGQLLPSRDSLLRVALVLGLDVNETQYLLKVGRRARLTPRDTRDAVVLHCIIQHKSLLDSNLILDGAGEEAL
jgi:transcriptional regulator with XRE-family HTH domain